MKPKPQKKKQPQDNRVVYVVEECIDYEGCSVEGVFSTFEKAEEFRKEKAKETKGCSSTKYYTTDHLVQ